MTAIPDITTVPPPTISPQYLVRSSSRQTPPPDKDSNTGVSSVHVQGLTSYAGSESPSPSAVHHFHTVRNTSTEEDANVRVNDRNRHAHADDGLDVELPALSDDNPIDATTSGKVEVNAKIWLGEKMGGLVSKSLGFGKKGEERRVNGM